MASSWILSLAEGIAVSDGDEGEILFSDSYSRLVQRRLSPALSDALRRLASPGETAERLAESVFTAEGSGALARWYYALQHLARRGFLHIAVASDRDRLATLVPIAASFAFTGAPRRPTALTACRGSPICTGTERKRCWNHRWPSRGSILHDDRAAALVHALSRPATRGISAAASLA